MMDYITKNETEDEKTRKTIKRGGLEEVMKKEEKEQLKKFKELKVRLKDTRRFEIMIQTFIQQIVIVGEYELDTTVYRVYRKPTTNNVKVS